MHNKTLPINTSAIINYLEAWANNTMSSRTETGSGQLYQEMLEDYDSRYEQARADCILMGTGFVLGAIVMYVIMCCCCRRAPH
jgi:hypothetical protein